MPTAHLVAETGDTRCGTQGRAQGRLMRDIGRGSGGVSAFWSTLPLSPTSLFMAVLRRRSFRLSTLRGERASARRTCAAMRSHRTPTPPSANLRFCAQQIQNQNNFKVAGKCQKQNVYEPQHFWVFARTQCFSLQYFSSGVVLIATQM